MKIPLIWLKDYIDIKKTPKEISDSFTAFGLLLDKPFKDDVFDLEHRMDRSDWLSILGCVRDLAAFEKTKLKQPIMYSKGIKKIDKNEKIEIKVECSDLINRFNTRIFKNIKVMPSPDWLKFRLESYGIPSINNIVDITNFVMVELGQPMHAQDINKLKKKEIVIRRALNGEKMISFLGEELKLDEDIFVLTQDGIPTVIGGMVGSKETGVDEKTTDIILDAGNYDQVNIRKNSRKLKIQNETVLRYDKYLHPKLTEIAMARATELILKLAGGQVFENEDYFPNKDKYNPKKMSVRKSRIEKLGGIEVKLDYMKHILERLEYKILKKNGDTLLLEIPYFRTDIEVEDDIAGDILRMVNFQTIPVRQLNYAPPKEITPKIYKFEENLRDICARNGLHEHIIDPLVKYNEENSNQVKLLNSLNDDKDALRVKLLPGLKKVSDFYKKNQIYLGVFFEIGNVYEKVQDKYIEHRTLGVLVFDENKTSLELSKALKIILQNILNDLGIKDYENISKICQFSENGFEIDTTELMKRSKFPTRHITTIENYTTENLSLVSNISVSFGDVINHIKETSPEIVAAYGVNEMNLGNNKKSVLLEIVYKTNDTKKIREEIVEKLKALDITHKSN